MASVGRRTCAVEAEHGDAVHRINEIRGLDHVVLLVAPEAVLGPERGGDLEAAHGHQGIQRVLETGRHGCGVREQSDAPASELPAQAAIGEELVNAEVHAC